MPNHGELPQLVKRRGDVRIIGLQGFLADGQGSLVEFLGLSGVPFRRGRLGRLASLGDRLQSKGIGLSGVQRAQLIEQPGQDLSAGMSLLARALAAGPARSPDQLCDSVLASTGRHARDDIALLLARTTAQTAS